jgi:hypothetical protein
MGGVGLDKNNVADVFAMYWISAWQAANGDSAVPKKTQFVNVAKQAMLGLAGSKAFASATDAQKQEYAEALMVQSLILDSHMEAAGNDPEKLKAISDLVRKGSKQSGIYIDEVVLTDDGFVLASGRRGADASGAMDNDIKQASAVGSDKALQYGLMAALGLGAAFMIGKGMKRG